MIPEANAHIVIPEWNHDTLSVLVLIIGLRTTLHPVTGKSPTSIIERGLAFDPLDMVMTMALIESTGNTQMFPDHRPVFIMNALRRMIHDPDLDMIMILIVLTDPSHRLTERSIMIIIIFHLGGMIYLAIQDPLHWTGFVTTISVIATRIAQGS